QRTKLRGEAGQQLEKRVRSLAAFDVRPRQVELTTHDKAAELPIGAHLRAGEAPARSDKGGCERDLIGRGCEAAAAPAPTGVEPDVEAGPERDCYGRRARLRKHVSGDRRMRG